MPDDFARQGRYLTGHYNDFHYRTPLHLAAATGNDEITKFLLVNKAKTNLCDNDGRTALMKVRPLVYTDRHMILKWRRSLDVQGLKKYLWFWFPTDPIFFLPTLLFFHCNIDRATLFSPGGCGLLIQRAKMVSVVTLIIEPNCLNSSIGNTHF